MKTLRLRQAVVAAADRAAVAAVWSRELGTGEPFADPGVGEFGLCNAVLPVGDTFLEVVSPIEAGSSSSAGRFLARNGGDCGNLWDSNLRARPHSDDADSGKSAKYQRKSRRHRTCETGWQRPRCLGRRTSIPPP